MMSEDYLYDASLINEEVWLDYWRMNGEARITIERPNPSGGNPALMQPPQQNPATIKGVRAVVTDIDISDYHAAAGRMQIGDKRFETLDEIRYGDNIIFDNQTYEVFRIDIVVIGEMKVYSTKAHKVS
jgi:hypothetical protein